jgi:hypothetical protein
MQNTVIVLYGVAKQNGCLALHSLLLHVVRRYWAATMEEWQTLLFSFCVFLANELAVTRYFVVKSFSACSFVPFWFGWWVLGALAHRYSVRLRCASYIEDNRVKTKYCMLMYWLLFVTLKRIINVFHFRIQKQTQTRRWDAKFSHYLSASTQSFVLSAWFAPFSLNRRQHTRK